MSLPVLITGASQRLGLAMAESLLDQKIPVVITYRTYKPSVASLKERGATVIQADFSTEQAIDRAIAEIKAINKSSSNQIQLRTEL